MSTNGPVNLFIGNNPWASGQYDEKGLQQKKDLGLKDSYLQLVLGYWKNYTFLIPNLYLKKLSFLLFEDDIDYRGAGGSIGLSINARSILPKIITGKTFDEILAKENSNIKQIFLHNYSQKINLYYLRESIDPHIKSFLANQILYSFSYSYPENRLFRRIEFFSG